MREAVTAADREAFAGAVRAVCAMDEASLAEGLALVRGAPSRSRRAPAAGG